MGSAQSGSRWGCGRTAPARRAREGMGRGPSRARRAGVPAVAAGWCATHERTALIHLQDLAFCRHLHVPDLPLLGLAAEFVDVLPALGLLVRRLELHAGELFDRDLH